MENCKAKFSLVKLPVDEDPNINKIESLFKEIDISEYGEFYISLIFQGIIMHIGEKYDLEELEILNCLTRLQEAENWWAS